ncbi:MAG TPA: FkbM family methyltransferase [Verrucomicrobiae bacterium]|nr:FkbM family methyltransferase [Verrucomicrobiae bacterium]
MSGTGAGGGSIRSAARAALPPAVWTLLRGIRLKWAAATFRRRIVEHRYGGHPLRILIADEMGRDWYDVDWPEPPVVEALRRHRLREGALVLNVGAHQGVMALILARATGRSGRIVAVEAVPFNASLARTNRDLNDAPQITVVHAAVGERAGVLHFNPSLNGAVEPGGAAWGRLEVQAITVDELARRHGAPDVLFMDIEGFECRALRGAAETLARRPDCVIEVHTGGQLESFGGSLEGILEFFPPAEFTLMMAPEWKTAESDPGCRPFNAADDLVKRPFHLLAIGTKGATA